MTNPPGILGAVMPDHEEFDPVLAGDPLADLLLSVAAIIVLAVLAILPSLPQRDASTAEAEVEFQLDGRRVTPWLATAAGLAIDAPPTTLIPLDRMFLDQTLAATLQGMQRTSEPLVLFIAPGGSEAAFQLEVIASRHGIRRIRQVRLDSGCERTIALHCARRPPLPSEQVR
ncbi:hypothetical protein XH83_13250 [Bradyrhizobium sp. CCBAU 53351]|uniref:hypothetical protein n=1 Tax=Bradyrhizobium sp. CCBAU 53351 TaxID=1325114 RepID=UPI0018898842|nr:hypothetical protein [Bradyrhizobium sp. CCBAU 53351]QOZ76328.1 hypothetical protein XH83_13250 [Bradyrhizobium sp. CCBAU 53351]